MTNACSQVVIDGCDFFLFFFSFFSLPDGWTKVRADLIKRLIRVDDSEKVIRSYEFLALCIFVLAYWEGIAKEQVPTMSSLDFPLSETTTREWPE